MNDYTWNTTYSIDSWDNDWVAQRTVKVYGDGDKDRIWYSDVHHHYNTDHTIILNGSDWIGVKKGICKWSDKTELMNDYSNHDKSALYAGGKYTNNDFNKM